MVAIISMLTGSDGSLFGQWARVLGSFFYKIIFEGFSAKMEEFNFVQMTKR